MIYNWFLTRKELDAKLKSLTDELHSVHLVSGTQEKIINELQDELTKQREMLASKEKIIQQLSKMQKEQYELLMKINQLLAGL